MQTLTKLHHDPPNVYDNAIYTIADVRHVETRLDVRGDPYLRIHVEIDGELYTVTYLFGNPFQRAGWPEGEYPAEVLLIDDATFLALWYVPPYPEREVTL